MSCPRLRACLPTLLCMLLAWPILHKLNAGGFHLFHATFGETLNAEASLLARRSCGIITLFTKLNRPDAE